MMLALARQGQRSESLAQYATCCEVLEVELGVAPSAETVALYETIVHESLPPLVPTAVSPLHHFPTTFTPFVGRQDECAQICQNLQDPHCRLLTIVAPGGTGKTRLALQAIQHTLHHEQNQLVSHFPDGAYFVPLAEATTAAQLLSGIAQALALPAESSQSQLANFLQEKRLLLVLDNVEQLPDTAVVLTNLLQSAPHLHLLLTSRVPLGTQAEWLLRLDGLPYPAPTSTANPHHYPAVQLFLQAAQRTQPQFQADETTLATIVHICQLVGGMPLALEIAASWLRLLTCAQIVAQIRHSLDFLQIEGGAWPARHRSMRLILEQAWSFLDPPEQKALAQLAHMAGSFNLEAAQAVAAISLPTLSRLRDQSWVQRLETGRYALHPLIHQFAAEQLTAQPALAERTHTAHSRYYLQLVLGYGAALHGPRAQAVLQELRQEQPNLVLAWHTAVSQHQWPLIQASHQSYADYHLISGQLAEGTSLLATALAQLDTQKDPALAAALRLEQARLLIEQGKLPPAATLLQQVAASPILPDTPALRARLHLEQGHLQELQGDYPTALTDLQTALTYYQASGNLRHQAQTIGFIGNVYWRQGEYDQALDQCYRALALAQDMGDLAHQAVLLANIGIIHVDKSNFDQGVHYYQQALSIDAQLGNRAHVARHTHNIARVYRLQGKLTEALDYFQRALQVAEELGLRRGVSLCLTNMGIIHKDLGQYGLAETTYQRALHITRELNLPDGESNLLGNLGNLYRVMARYEAANVYYEQALAVAQAIGFREGEARHLGNMAETAMLQRDWEKARPWLDQGIKILRELGDIYYISPLLLLQAETMLELGEPACAKTLLSEALALTAQTGRTDYHEQATALAARLGIAPPPDNDIPPITAVTRPS
ncbi:MAG: tetratricopeptide repeat protein, partial [Anaerolineales bacterium]|nr:tetratricopeptide repeat protein [Anaerolineales bacterium]